MSQNEKEFPKGIFFKENKLDWIMLTVNINREQCIEWLSSKNDDYINIDIKTSKSGNIYSEVNNWKPVTDNLPGGTNFDEAIKKQKDNGGKIPDEFNNEDDIPF